MHNPNVTLMRTTPEENRAMGEWIGAKLNACQGPVRFLIPEKGVSLIDTPGMPFHDPDADAALFEALERTVEQTPARRLIRLPLHINDARFRPGSSWRAGARSPPDPNRGRPPVPGIDRRTLLDKFYGA